MCAIFGSKFDSKPLDGPQNMPLKPLEFCLPLMLTNIAAKLMVIMNNGRFGFPQFCFKVTDMHMQHIP